MFTRPRQKPSWPIHALADEVFGPFGLVVRVRRWRGDDHGCPQGFEGQLTATLLMDKADTPLARRLLPVLERKAGRILANGFPTGVEVATPWCMAGPIRPRPISAPPRSAPWRFAVS
ncbi:MAG: hypothetical protein QM711_12715 [Micropruina sp.]|uniref:hypothetical protein n=1 Tax=Micropruina sp. TaxID=2737536 RepID=UPI0039E45D7D